MIEKILSEAEALTNAPALVVHERVTQLCCQLDAIDTQGSVPLRQFRKAALARVQAVEEGTQPKTAGKEKEEASANKAETPTD